MARRSNAPARDRRAGWWALTAALIAATAALTWWAARATLTPTTMEGGDSNDPVLVAVVEGTVGRTIGVGVTLEQPAEVVATNSLSGIVTAVHDTSVVDVGSVAFAVASVPVRVVEGGVPFYRDLASGAQGEDVRQLQAALSALGYLSSSPDGVFGRQTHEAVRAWQKDLGIARTGVVALGEVLAVRTLPGSVSLGESLRVGVPVSGGEPAVLASTGAQEFTLVLSADQAAMITAEVPIRVLFEDLVWQAQVAGSRTGEGGYTVLDLVSPDGGSVCGDDCARLPADERLSLRGEAVVTPEVTGPVVPAAAVRLRPDGQAQVELADGTRRDVTVLASLQGIAVLDGVVVGEKVVVIGAARTDGADPAPPTE